MTHTPETTEWSERMAALLRNHFPWQAKATAGRWGLYDNRGACLAIFHLDSGHGARLAAAAPELLAEVERLRTALEQIAAESHADTAYSWCQTKLALCNELARTALEGTKP